MKLALAFVFSLMSRVSSRPRASPRLTIVSLARACERRFDRNRPRRAAGAEDDQRLARGIDDRAQRFHESDAVGVLADQLVAAPDRAIDGADRRRRLAEAVEMGNDRHLMRDRAIEASPAHGAGAARCVPERRRLDLAIDVARVHSMMPERRLDHRHGRIFRRRRREGADQGAEEIMGHASCSRPRRRRRRRCRRPTLSPQAALWQEETAARAGPANRQRGEQLTAGADPAIDPPEGQLR